MSEPEIVRPTPDAERDERVRLRRAADARRAGVALDALLSDRAGWHARGCLGAFGVTCCCAQPNNYGE